MLPSHRLLEVWLQHVSVAGALLCLAAGCSDKNKPSDTGDAGSVDDGGLSVDDGGASSNIAADLCGSDVRKLISAPEPNMLQVVGSDLYYKAQDGVGTGVFRLPLTSTMTTPTVVLSQFVAPEYFRWTPGGIVAATKTTSSRTLVYVFDATTAAAVAGPLLPEFELIGFARRDRMRAVGNLVSFSHVTEYGLPANDPGSYAGSNALTSTPASNVRVSSPSYELLGGDHDGTTYFYTTLISNSDSSQTLDVHSAPMSGNGAQTLIASLPGSACPPSGGGTPLSNVRVDADNAFVIEWCTIEGEDKGLLYRVRRGGDGDKVTLMATFLDVQGGQQSAEMVLDTARQEVYLLLYQGATAGTIIGRVPYDGTALEMLGTLPATVPRSIDLTPNCVVFAYGANGEQGISTVAR